MDCDLRLRSVRDVYLRPSERHAQYKHDLYGPRHAANGRDCDDNGNLGSRSHEVGDLGCDDQSSASARAGFDQPFAIEFLCHAHRNIDALHPAHGDGHE